MLAGQSFPKRLPRLDSLTRSFISVLTVYQLAQIGLFALYSVPLGFFASYAIPFGLSSIGFHCLLFVMLEVFKGDFVIEPDGRKLDRVNLANAITLFRVSTLPTILFIIIASKDYPVIRNLYRDIGIVA